MPPKAASEPPSTGTSSSFASSILEYLGLKSPPPPPKSKLRYERKLWGEEANNYDFAAARTLSKRTNFIESVGHLIKSCLGGGMVGIHEAYKATGLWSAVSLNVVLGFLVAYVMVVLARSAQKVYGRAKVNELSYPDLAEATLSITKVEKLRKYAKTFRYMIDVTICIDLFGSCCCYQVIIARTLDQLAHHFTTVPEWMTIRVWLLFLWVPCILICMITTLKYLAPFSIVADVFILLVCISTVVYGSMNAQKSPTEFEVIKSPEGLFEFIGVCVFSMEGIGAVLPIENAMEEPKNVTMVMTIGMTFVVSIVMLIGFFGYWGYGEAAIAPVTMNFGFSPWPLFLKGAMALVIYVTFALNFWIPFNLVWFYLKKRHDESTYWYTERVYRAIFVSLVTIVAIAFPEVSKLMGLIGAFCLSNMGFIYPAFIQLLLDFEDPGFGTMKYRLIRGVVIIVFGLIVMIIGSIFNARELFRAVYGDKQVTTPTPDAA